MYVYDDIPLFLLLFSLILMFTNQIGIQSKVFHFTYTEHLLFCPILVWEDQILGCRYISFENKVRNHITHLHYLQCQRQRLIYFILEIIIISCGSCSSPCCISINIRRLNWFGTLNVSLWECLHQSLHYKLEERRKKIFSNAQISIFLLHKMNILFKE